MSRPKYLNSVKTEGRRWADDVEVDEEKFTPNDRLWRFLRNVRCEDCYKKLQENRIGFDDLKFLKESDVLELGFPIGLRNRLLNALEGQQEDDATLRVKDIWALVNEVLAKQGMIAEGIRKCTEEIQDLQNEFDGQSDIRRNREKFSNTSPKVQRVERVERVERVRKPTISSIAKQNVIPNKYMQVSPLRASYYSRLMD